MFVIHSAFPSGAQITWTETAFIRVSESPGFTLPVCLLVKEGGQSAMA